MARLSSILLLLTRVKEWGLEPGGIWPSVAGTSV